MKKGYIYTMYKGADPGAGWKMTDPIYEPIPTLGACMPNIRRVVTKGDFIFSISGRVEGANQYVVGGFEVDEKINGLIAYKRFPKNRMIQNEDGSLAGNIIIDKDGKQLPFDYHTNHEKRIENYIVGKNPLYLQKPEHIETARKETLDLLNDIFGKKEKSVSSVIGRWRKLDEKQISDLRDWMADIKRKT